MDTNFTSKNFFLTRRVSKERRGSATCMMHPPSFKAYYTLKRCRSETMYNNECALRMEINNGICNGKAKVKRELG
jgi:hypothetical protein